MLPPQKTSRSPQRGDLFYFFSPPYPAQPVRALTENKMARSGAIFFFFSLLSNPREPGPLPSQHAPRFSNEFRFEFAVWAPFSSVEAAEPRWEPEPSALPRPGASLGPDAVSPRRYQPRGGARRAERAAVRRRAGGAGGASPAGERGG